MNTTAMLKAMAIFGTVLYGTLSAQAAPLRVEISTVNASGEEGAYKASLRLDASSCVVISPTDNVSSSGCVSMKSIEDSLCTSSQVVISPTDNRQVVISPTDNRQVVISPTDNVVISPTDNRQVVISPTDNVVISPTDNLSLVDRWRNNLCSSLSSQRQVVISPTDNRQAVSLLIVKAIDRQAQEAVVDLDARSNDTVALSALGTLTVDVAQTLVDFGVDPEAIDIAALRTVLAPLSRQSNATEVGMWAAEQAAEQWLEGTFSNSSDLASRIADTLR